MVKASDSITLHKQPDIQEVIYYYKKQSSTSAAPAKPTAYPAAGWITTEPSYSTEETSTLYVCVCTLYTDGTYGYSEVSVSAAFEAAKEAYNRAVAAADAAEDALTTANGKNRIFYQDSEPGAGMSEGDLWFDTDGGNAIYEYKKTASNPDTYAWIIRQLAQGALAANSVTAVEINVANLAAISANLGTITAGLLKSSDYSYSSGNYSAAGMMIDLNNKIIRTPKTAILEDGSLYATSGNFSGTVKATAGTIGGWSISSNYIQKAVTISGVTYTPRIYAPESPVATNAAFVVMRTENGTTTYPFYVRYNGALQATDANITGKINARGGQIGGFSIVSSDDDSGYLKTTAAGGYRYRNALYRHAGDGTYEYEVGMKGDASSSDQVGNYAFYVGRITAGGKWAARDNGGDWTVLFGVTHAGKLYAQNADIKGKVTASSGSIGSFTIGTGIYSNSKSSLSHANNGVYIGTDGISLGANSPFKVTNAGVLTATSGTIGGWKINGTSLYKGNGWRGTTAGDAYIGDNGISFTGKNFYLISTSEVSTNLYFGIGSTTQAAYISMESGFLGIGGDSISEIDLFKNTKITGTLRATGNIRTDVALGTGGKTAWNDTTNNGVWLTSSGTIHLSESATSGGLIGFHYNFAANSTASIQEVASGYIRFRNYVSAQNGMQIIGGATRGTTPTAQFYRNICWTDSAGTADTAHRYAAIEHSVNTSRTSYMYMGVYNPTTSNTGCPARIYLQVTTAGVGTVTITGNTTFSYSGTGVAEVLLNAPNTTDNAYMRVINKTFEIRMAAHSSAGIYSAKPNAKWLISINSSGTVTANTSDERYKNVAGEMPEEEALCILRECEIVNFTYKADEKKVMQNGIIAQQLRDVLQSHDIGYRPYLFIESTRDDTIFFDLNTPEEDIQYGVDYGRMVPVLWKGWQSHDERITALEQENKELRAQIRAMKGAA